MKNNFDIHAEYISWRIAEINLSVVGILVNENEKEVHLASTIGNRGYVDEVQIPKKSIVERKTFTVHLS